MRLTLQSIKKRCLPLETLGVLRGIPKSPARELKTPRMIQRLNFSVQKEPTWARQYLSAIGPEREMITRVFLIKSAVET